MSKSSRSRANKQANKHWIVGLALLAGLAIQPDKTWAAPAIAYSGEITAGKQAEPALKAVICSPAQFGAIGSDCHLSEVRVLGDWAWVMWGGGEAGGSSVLKRTGKTWKHVMGGGGAMIVANAIEEGVPRDKAEFLVPIADFNTPEDLRNLSAWELLVMRNRVYARHGRRFSDARLQRYFESWPWYKARKDYSDKALSPTEKQYIDLIRRIEKEKGYL